MKKLLIYNTKNYLKQKEIILVIKDDKLIREKKLVYTPAQKKILIEFSVKNEFLFIEYNPIKLYEIIFNNELMQIIKNIQHILDEYLNSLYMEENINIEYGYRVKGDTQKNSILKEFLNILTTEMQDGD